MLAAGLNDHKGESRCRLLALLAGCRQLPRLLAEARPSGRPDAFTDLITYRLASRPEHRTLLRKIDVLLKRYRLRWGVESVVFARPGKNRVIQFPLVGAPGSTPRGDRGKEIFTVQQLLRLTELQALDRVRECAECQRWFMARRRNQNFCQVVCRRRKQRGQQNKEAFALYQKWYRREQKIKMWESRLRRARPSVRQQIRAEIVELRNNGKAFLEQRWRLLQADK